MIETMRRQDIITRQQVRPEKAERAQEFRRAMTPTEQALWQQLRAGRLGGLHFRRQQIIAGYIVDFYCHSAALVVEVDGEIHETREDDDASRDAALRSLDLRVLRVPTGDVQKRITHVLRAIRTAAREASKLHFET